MSDALDPARGKDWRPERRSSPGDPNDPLARFEALASTIPRSTTDDLRLLPTRLSQVAAQVLPVDGAAISVMLGPGISVPIGASDTDATVAEQVQYTLGEGPCFRAYNTARPAFVLDLQSPLTPWQATWPAYAGEVTRHTPYRAVLAYPLLAAGSPMGSLNLYRHHPVTVLTTGTLADMKDMAARISTALLSCGVLANPDGDLAYPWLDAPTAHRRRQVALAQGMTMEATGLTAPQALDALRAHAFATDTTADDIADDIVAGRLLPAQFHP